MTAAAEAINQVAGTWWPFVLHATWQSSLLAGIFLVAVRLGRRWPAQLRYALVLIALVKFAVPPTLSLPTGLFTRLGPVVVLDADEPAPLRRADPADRRADAGAGAWAAVTRTLGDVSWQGWLLMVHAAGCLAMGAWLAAQWASILRMARRARRLSSGPLWNRVGVLCRKVHLRRPVRLLIAPEPVSPMAFGVLRPSVLVPASLLRTVTPHQMDTILAHELAHHRRGDILVNWCQAALGTLWWFNPVLWALNRAVRRAREDCCDDLLLAGKFTTDGAYCQALLKAATGLRRGLLAAAASGFAQRIHPLGERIGRIMDPRLHRVPKLSLATLALMLAVAGLVLPGLRSGRPSAAEPADLLSATDRPDARAAGRLHHDTARAIRLQDLRQPMVAGTDPWDMHWPRSSAWLGDIDDAPKTLGPRQWPSGGAGPAEPFSVPRSGGRLLDVYGDMDPAGPDLVAPVAYGWDTDIAREVWPDNHVPDAHPFQAPVRLAGSGKPAAEDLPGGRKTPSRFARDDATLDDSPHDPVTIIEVAEKTLPRSAPLRAEPLDPAGAPWDRGLGTVVLGPAPESTPVAAWEGPEPVILAESADTEGPAPVASGGSADAWPDGDDDWLRELSDLRALLDGLPPGELPSSLDAAPEPASLAVLALGGLVLLSRRRRRG